MSPVAGARRTGCRVPDGVVPTGTQRSLIRRVCDAVRSSAAESTQAQREPWTADDAIDGVPSALKIPRWANAVAILGGRGAGKTLLLSSVLDELEFSGRDVERPPYHRGGAASPAGAGAAGGNLLVLDTVDLSLCPSGFPQGVVVLQKVHQALERRARQLHAEGPLDLKVEAAFQACIQASFRGQAGYEAMLRDGAASPEHYTETASREIAARLDLYRLVRIWLDLAAERARADLFVVGIDDFDLAPPPPEGGGRVSLIWSLLDELHQPRLMFVLAADGDRLASTVEADGLPEPTASELVYKALPRYMRFVVPSWPDAERRGFCLKKLDSKQHSIGALLDQLRLDDSFRNKRWLVEGVTNLLPPYPRGLENLARTLRALSEGAEGVLSAVLPALAEARGEHRLAQELTLRDAAGIALSFGWPGEAVPLTPAQALDLEKAEPTAPWLRPESPSLDPRRLGPDSLRWALLLLDGALASDALTASGLIQRIPPARAAWGAAELCIDVERREMQRWVAASERAGLAAWFWLVPVPQGEGDWYRIRLGLPALLAIHQADRGLFPDGFHSDLGEPAPDLIRLVGDGPELASYEGRRRPCRRVPLPGRARLLLLVLLELERTGRGWAGAAAAAEGVLAAGRLAAVLSLGALLRLRLRAQPPVGLRPDLAQAAAAVEPYLRPDPDVASGRFGAALGAELERRFSLLPTQGAKATPTRRKQPNGQPSPVPPRPSPSLPTVEQLGGPVALSPSEVAELDDILSALLESPAVQHLRPFEPDPPTSPARPG